MNNTISLPYIYLLFFSICLVACGPKADYEPIVNNPQDMRDGMERLSEVIVHDIFSPPVASRNYAYPSIAAYEVWAHADSNYLSLAGQINEFTAGPDAPVETYSPSVAALQAFFVTAKNYIFSEARLVELHEEMITKWKKSGMPSSILKRSMAYGDAMAAHVIEYSKSDNYAQTRTFPKYSITSDPAKWKPTPPGYMDGIEPHWRDIRPFVLDSAQQFIPKSPTEFSMEIDSRFYQEAKEVYDVVNNADAEQKEIASFWDCNPYKLNVTGHVMHATKKITPGGHWIGIIGIATEKAGADMGQTIEAYTLTSIALFDGFISCWDEKYRSNLIRPETVINEHIDENWVPFLQTPPFPEHTSGHSVISRAAAVALTSIFGDNFEYEDNVELQYGLPIRKFKSFYHASDEAAVSRLYGGIHYRPAIDYGVEQGELVGKYVVSKIKMKA